MGGGKGRNKRGGDGRGEDYNNYEEGTGRKGEEGKNE